MQTTCLLYDRLTGVQVGCRRRRLAGGRTRLGRCRCNVRRGSGRLTGDAGSRLTARVETPCLLHDRGRRGSDRLRGRRTGLTRFRGNCARQSLEWGEVM